MGSAYRSLAEVIVDRHRPALRSLFQCPALALEAPLKSHPQRAQRLDAADSWSRTHEPPAHHPALASRKATPGATFGLTEHIRASSLLPGCPRAVNWIRGSASRATPP